MAKAQAPEFLEFQVAVRNPASLRFATLQSASFVPQQQLHLTEKCIHLCAIAASGMKPAHQTDALRHLSRCLGVHGAFPTRQSDKGQPFAGTQQCRGGLLHLLALFLGSVLGRFRQGRARQPVKRLGLRVFQDFPGGASLIAHPAARAVRHLGVKKRFRRQIRGRGHRPGRSPEKPPPGTGSSQQRHHPQNTGNNRDFFHPHILPSLAPVRQAFLISPWPNPHPPANLAA